MGLEVGEGQLTDKRNPTRGVGEGGKYRSVLINFRSVGSSVSGEDILNSAVFVMLSLTPDSLHSLRYKRCDVLITTKHHRNVKNSNPV